VSVPHVRPKGLSSFSISGQTLIFMEIRMSTCHIIDSAKITPVYPLIIFILSGNYLKTFKENDTIKIKEGEYRIESVGFLDNHNLTFAIVKEI